MLFYNTHGLQQTTWKGSILWYKSICASVCLCKYICMYVCRNPFLFFLVIEGFWMLFLTSKLLLKDSWVCTHFCWLMQATKSLKSWSSCQSTRPIRLSFCLWVWDCFSWKARVDKDEENLACTWVSSNCVWSTTGSRNQGKVKYSHDP